MRTRQNFKPERDPDGHGYVRVLGDLLVVHAEGLSTAQIHELAVNNRRLLILMQAKAREARKVEDNIAGILGDTAETMTPGATKESPGPTGTLGATEPGEEAVDEETWQSWLAETVREEEPMMTGAEAVEYFGASATAFKKWAEEYRVYPVIKNRRRYYRVSDVEMLKDARDRRGRKAYTKKVTR